MLETLWCCTVQHFLKGSVSRVIMQHLTAELLQEKRKAMTGDDAFFIDKSENDPSKTSDDLQKDSANSGATVRSCDVPWQLTKVHWASRHCKEAATDINEDAEVLTSCKEIYKLGMLHWSNCEMSWQEHVLRLIQLTLWWVLACLWRTQIICRLS